MIKLVILLSCLSVSTISGVCLFIVGKYYDERLQILGAILLLLTIILFVSINVLTYKEKGD